MSAQTTSRRSGRAALTLVELLVVIGIMATLAGLTVPTMIAALRSTGVQQTVDKLMRTMHQAQALARRGLPDSMATNTPFYGVAIIADGAGSYATVLYGTSATDELDPTLRAPLRGGEIWAGFGGAPAQPLATTVAWFYQYGSGQPIARPSFQEAPTTIGTAAQGAMPAYTWSSTTFEPVPASPIATELSVHARGQDRVVYLGQLALGAVFTTERIP